MRFNAFAGPAAARNATPSGPTRRHAPLLRALLCRCSLAPGRRGAPTASRRARRDPSRPRVRTRG
ncbi:hypothetical protein GCM10020218_020690 [Dactylosporangium vinaceum]